MAKGIIYIMTTAVPGLIKIGKTNTANYKDRMYNLEHNGYRNVASLKRAFAIEVENFDEKEALLHNIFEKSQVSNTELFAVDVNLVIQLLSSFEGRMIYPEPQHDTKSGVFGGAAKVTQSKQIPDGIYVLQRKKVVDNLLVHAKAKVENGYWTLLKGSQCGITDDGHGSDQRNKTRAILPVDADGILTEDFDLGACSPSFAGSVAMNSSTNGWTEWKTPTGKPIDEYRKAYQEAHKDD